MSSSTTFSKTVLILGAGASYPYLFPTARELTEMIRGSLPRRLYHLVNKPETFGNQSLIDNSWKEVLTPVISRFQMTGQEFLRTLAAADVYSVDKFAHYHPRHEKIARWCIAQILLLCEQKYVQPSVGDWYRQFWNAVVIPDWESGRPPLEVVTFNYDRSLEWYLLKTGNALADAHQSVHCHVRIHHVYGSLGALEGERAVEYGADWQAETSADYINLISRQTEALQHIRDVIVKCERAVFLGFGFDDLNLKTLGIDKQNRPSQIFASRLGLSKPTQSRALSAIGEIHWGGESDDVFQFIHRSQAFDME